MQPKFESYVQFEKFSVGWHFAIVGDEAANLITAIGSVGCGFALAASTCIGSQTMVLQTYDLTQSCESQALLEFEVQFWRASRTSVS